MLSTGLTRREAYAEYRRSDRWRQIRADALERDGFRCALCNSPNHLQIHHRRYPKRWHQDNVTNVVTLCRVHHEEHHRIATGARRWFVIGCGVGAFTMLALVSQLF